MFNVLNEICAFNAQIFLYLISVAVTELRLYSLGHWTTRKGKYGWIMLLWVILHLKVAVQPGKRLPTYRRSCCPVPYP